MFLLRRYLRQNEAEKKYFEVLKNWYEKNNVEIVDMINETFKKSEYKIELFVIE